MRTEGLAGLALIAFALGSATTVQGLTLGSPHMTPDMQTLPVHGFRIDVGVLSDSGVRSLRSGRKGDLWGPYLAISYGAAPNAVLMVDGMVYKKFDPEHGRGTDAVGDFVVWGKFILGTDPTADEGFGIRFGAKLPNTPSNTDFGTNQTDFFMHLFAERDRSGWHVSVYGGIGILERPGGVEAQDDVAMGGILVRRNALGGHVGIELEGFTKSRIYGDNWALRTSFEHALTTVTGYLFGAQYSNGNLYGSSEVRAGLVFRF